MWPLLILQFVGFLILNYNLLDSVTRALIPANHINQEALSSLGAVQQLGWWSKCVRYSTKPHSNQACGTGPCLVKFKVRVVPADNYTFLYYLQWCLVTGLLSCTTYSGAWWQVYFLVLLTVVPGAGILSCTTWAANLKTSKFVLFMDFLWLKFVFFILSTPKIRINTYSKIKVTILLTHTPPYIPQDSHWNLRLKFPDFMTFHDQKLPIPLIIFTYFEIIPVESGGQGAWTLGKYMRSRKQMVHFCEFCYIINLIFPIFLDPPSNSLTTFNSLTSLTCGNPNSCNQIALIDYREIITPPHSVTPGKGEGEGHHWDT